MFGFLMIERYNIMEYVYTYARRELWTEKSCS